MFGYRFINEMCQRWQDRPWIKLDEVTPYNYRHREQRGVMNNVGEFHFKRYCGCGSRTNAEIHKASKRKKLYWRLHPEYKYW